MFRFVFMSSIQMNFNNDVEGGEFSVNEIEIDHVVDSRASEYNETLESQYFRLKLRIRVCMTAPDERGNRDSFFIIRNVFYHNLVKDDKCRRDIKNNKVVLGQYIKTTDVAKLKNHIITLSDSKKGVLYIFSEEGIGNIMVRSKLVCCRVQFDKFLDNTRIEDRMETFLEELNWDTVKLVSPSTNLEDFSNLQVRIQRYVRMGIQAEQHSKSVMVPSNMSDLNIQKKILEVGSFVLKNGFDTLSLFIAEEHSLENIESNVACFMVEDLEKGGKRKLLLENMKCTEISCYSELKSFQKEYDKKGGEKKTISRFSEEFKESEENFVMDYQVELTKRKFFSLFNLISKFVRNVDGKKDIHVYGVISTIYSCFSKQNRYFCRYIHPLMLSINLESSGFKFLNSVYAIAYYKKMDQSVKIKAEERINQSKIVGNRILTSTKDNVTKTNIFAFPPKRNDFTSHTYFLKENTYNITRIYKKTSVGMEEIDALYLEWDEVKQLYEKGREFGRSYVNLLKTPRGDFNLNPLEVFVMKPTVMVDYSYKEICSVCENCFDGFTFEEDKIENHIVVSAEDLGYYPHISRIYGLKICSVPGIFHFLMNAIEVPWKWGRRLVYMGLNVMLNLKCGYEFKGSKYQRYKRAVILNFGAGEEILDELGIGWEDLINGKIKNYQLKYYYILHILEGWYLCAVDMVMNNQYEDLIKSLPNWKNIFSISRKRNYKLCTFEHMIKHLCFSDEMKEYLKCERLVNIQHKHYHFGIDLLGEIMNYYEKKVNITLHGVDSWCKKMPVQAYYMFNYRNEFQTWMKYNKKDIKKRAVKKLWKIEKQMKLVKEEVKKRINPDNWNKERLMSYVGTFRKGLFDDCKLYKTSDPEIGFWNLFCNIDVDDDEVNWEKEKVKFWNEKGTLYKTRKVQEENMEDEGEEELDVEKWNAYDEELAQKEDDSGYYVPENDEEEDMNDLHLFSDH